MASGKQRDPAKCKAAILDTATEMFAIRGFERTSLAAIGAKAGVSRGLPAYFYGNKRGLYEAVMERASKQVKDLVVEKMRRKPANASILDVLDSLVRDYIDFLHTNPQAVRLLLWESLKSPDNRHEAPTALFNDAVDIVKRALKASGSSKDARLLVLSIVGMCFFPFGTGDILKINPAFTAAYKQHVVGLLKAGIAGSK